MTEKKQWLTAKELSDHLRVPKSWVYDWTRQGKLPCLRLGKYLRYDLEEVMPVLKKAEQVESSSCQ